MTSQTQKTGNPTVQDVAREANVSTATVSRALSTPERVSKNTRRRVAEAIEKTGYVLNHAARNLRRRNTGTIVALVPNIGNSHFSNVLQGIETVCAEKNLKVLIADTRKPTLSKSSLNEYFTRANCDGLIVLDGHFSISDVRAKNPDLPFVVMAGELSDDPNVPAALINNLMGTKLAMSHLLELGHTNIGHITGALDHLPGADRLEGFTRALKGAGLDPDKAWIVKGDYSHACGVEAARQFLALDNRPTAVFAASDHTAIAFISELSKAGVRVPEDVSIVGFDDLEITEFYIPPLTTIHQPRRKVGEQAAKLMLNLLEGGEPDLTRAQIEPWIVVRASTKRIK